MRDILYFREGMLVSYVGVTKRISRRLVHRNLLTSVLSVPYGRVIVILKCFMLVWNLICVPCYSLGHLWKEI
jgi:hypothetical protein